MHTPVCSTEDEVMQLFEASRTGIEAVLINRFGYSDLTDEILQQTRIFVFKQWCEFKPEKGRFFAWAVGVAIRLQHAAKRNLQRQRILLRDQDLEAILYHTQTTVSEADLERQYQALYGCLARLDPYQRRMLDWRVIEQQAWSDIAARTGQSSAGIRARMARLKKRLRQCVRQRLSQYLSQDDTE